MIDYISNSDIFKKYKMKKDSLLQQKAFEENPFSQNFKFFLGFEFDYIFHDSFFEGLKNFVKTSGDKTLVFYTINPSPEEYFYYHFKKYNVIELGVCTTDSELNDIMTKDPGESPSDALCLNSNDICWFSDSKDWAILGSRNHELAIVGFTELDMKNLFIDCYSSKGQTMFTSLRNQINALRDLSDEYTEESFNQLLQNYTRN